MYVFKTFLSQKNWVSYKIRVLKPTSHEAWRAVLLILIKKWMSMRKTGYFAMVTSPWLPQQYPQGLVPVKSWTGCSVSDITSQNVLPRDIFNNGTTNALFHFCGRVWRFWTLQYGCVNYSLGGSMQRI